VENKVLGQSIILRAQIASLINEIKDLLLANTQEKHLRKLIMIIMIEKISIITQNRLMA